MSFLEEFNMQWKSLQNTIESEIISQAGVKGPVNPTDISRKFENEKKRWLVSGQYNNAWLELLQSSKPDVAQEFEAELSKLQLQPILQVSQPNKAVIMLPALGCAILFGVVCHLLSASLLVDCVSAVGGGIIGSKIGSFLFNEKREESNRAERNFYKQQLSDMREKLAAIVKKADA